MERLTDKDEYGYYAPRDVTLNCLKHRGKLVDRLAAYEDTELEPEEIKAKLDGLDEFQKLEAEGRLLVLPCKVGETIYYLNPFDEIEKGRITMIQQKANGTLKFRVTTTSSHDATSDAFGKTVFLSREEAEEALGKEETSDD